MAALFLFLLDDDGAGVGVCGQKAGLLLAAVEQTTKTRRSPVFSRLSLQ